MDSVKKKKKKNVRFPLMFRDVYGSEVCVLS